MYMKLTPKQQQAMKLAIDWFKNDNKRPFVLSGVAGSGKTFTANKIIEAFNLYPENVKFVTFTGMAAGVITRRGQMATTIHRLIYIPIVKNNKVTFMKREHLDPNIKLIVVDEISMVGEDLFKDIQSFGIPILTLGDSAQLPPVNRKAVKFLDKPDIFLDEPVRQSLDNPIINIANMVRNKQELPMGKFADNVYVLNSNQIDNSFLELADQILVSYNNSASQINNKYRREILNINSETPSVGDKIICLRNNWDVSIFENNIQQYLTNGLIGTIKNINKDNDKTQATLFDFMPEYFDNEYYKNILFDNLVFDGTIERTEDLYELQKNDKHLKSIFKKRMVYESTTGKKVMPFNYAYAITIHKSQGSEYDNVLLYDQVTRGDRFRALYTGITRAKENLVIIKDR